MLDKFGRNIDYLRVSVTDRCNLRCCYCMPEEGVEQLSRDEILSLEELERIIRAGSNAGIRRVRITGGEPLVRRDVSTLIKKVSLMPGIKDISLTTNAILLADLAEELKEAGLKRVNISLDTLMEHKYKEITRRGSLGRVLVGIEKALALGLTPVKINVVVQRDFNLDEVRDFIRFTESAPIHVRFIEIMPMGCGGGLSDEFVSAEEIKKIVSEDYSLVKGELAGGGPADYFKVEGYHGTVGFIHAISRHFCARCNRLRLTADGRLRYCLQQEQSLDIKGPLRNGAAEAELVELFGQAVMHKPAGYRSSEWNKNSLMNTIGG
ncbi:GTP 3',8-cyclase MoaA [Metallumcola ferriviriculae]|uniref:GTP 3',8-cyclase n=1 Tax=Metallumcola ferriviriculae TaxID=3039180 RepID=A0AAU0UQC2_9FIRM|nr:GTP 3',8-cyclase MoaA [Desulfitibacteraceae bacterium MK1]